VERLNSESGVARAVRRVPLTFLRWILQHLVGNVRAAARARALLSGRTAPFDLVHVHGALAALLLTRTVRSCDPPIPLVYSEHDATPWTCRPRRAWEGSVRRAIYRAVNLRACRMATLVVPNYEALGNELSALAGLPRNKFVTVPNGFDGERATGGEVTTSRKAVHGVSRYCVFVGSLIDRKGPDILIRALSSVDIPCIIIGGGPMRQELQRLVAHANIAERVIFAGRLEPSEVYAYYREADFLVLPSVSETSPLVVIEALACGIPVLSTRLPGIAAIVHDGENGLLVDAGDVAGLTAGLRRLVTDSALASRLKARASEVELRSSLSWTVVVERLRAAYLQAVREVRRVPEVRDVAEAPELDEGLPDRRTSFPSVQMDPKDQAVVPATNVLGCSAAAEGANEAGISA
jgi:glycosyltransferase involved in cell wall biosynthesis